MANQTRTWYANKEHSIADNGSNVGNSGDDHAVIGKGNPSTSWLWRELIRYAHDFAGWEDAQLVSATMKWKTTTQVHTARGSIPRCQVARLTATFTASGGGENAWGSTYGTVYPGPSVANEGSMPVDADADGDYVSWDVTGQFEPMLPASCFKRDGTPGAAATNHGFRVRAIDETSTSRTTEFFSMRGSYIPRLVVVMNVIATPGAPTLGEPTGSKTSAPTTFNATATDTPSKYDVQVATDSGFTSLLWDASGLTSGITGSAVVATYAGTAQPSGVPLYWRMRTANSLGAYGAWSTAGSYSIAGLPVADITSPIDGALAVIWNLGEAVEWTDVGLHAKPEVKVTYTHPQGTPGTNIRLTLWNDDYSGATVQDFPGAYASGATYTLQVSRAWARNTWFRVESYATAGGVDGAASARKRSRMQWGQGLYTVPIGASTSDWRFENGSITAAGAKSAFLYRSRGATTGPWKSSIGAVAHDTNLDVLVRLSTSSANPTLGSMKALWSASAGAGPDHWHISGGALSLDPTFRRFGVKSMRAVSNSGVAANVWAGMDPGDEPQTVSPSTKYTASVYIHTLGQTLPNDAGLIVRDQNNNVIHVADVNGTGTTRNSSGHPEGWERLYSTFETLPDATAVWPGAYFGGTGVQEVRFDGWQLEEGTVASGWHPGGLGPAVVLDVGGIAVDATLGGILRLKGSGGGLRDVVELDANGLLIGGATNPVSLHSPQDSTLHVGRIARIRKLIGATEAMLAAEHVGLTWQDGRGPLFLVPDAVAGVNLRADIGWALTGDFTHSTTTTMANPGNGFVRLNHSNASSRTQMALSATTNLGQSIASVMSQVTSGTQVTLDWGTNGRFSFEVSSITDNGTWFLLTYGDGVLYGNDGSNNEASKVKLVFNGGTGGAGGSTAATARAGTASLPAIAAGATGSVVITLTPAMKDNLYSVAAIHNADSPRPFNISIGNTRTDTQFTVFLLNSDTVSRSPSIHWLVLPRTQ